MLLIVKGNKGGRKRGEGEERREEEGRERGSLSA